MHCCLRQIHRSNDAREAAVHDGDVCGLHGDVCACAHGDADIGGRQCRGVIDAVAHHCHESMLPGVFGFALDAFNPLRLAIRQYIADHSVDAHLARYRFGGGFRVPTEHDCAHATCLEGCNGFGRIRFDGVVCVADCRHSCRCGCCSCLPFVSKMSDALGDGAGFIEYNNGDVFCALQCARGCDENAIASSQPQTSGH